MADTRLKLAPKPKDIALPMSRLYVEDLERLADIFVTATSDRPILEIGGYELESAADVARVPLKEARSLLFAISFKPQVILSLNRHGGSIRIGDESDPAAAGLAQIAEDVVLRRRPWYWFLVNLRVAFPIMMAVSVIGVIVSWAGRPVSFIGVVLSLAGLAYYLTVLRFRFTRYTVIRFESHSARRSFLDRNRDQITVGVIIAIVSVLLGTVLGFFLRQP